MWYLGLSGKGSHFCSPRSKSSCLETRLGHLGITGDAKEERNPGAPRRAARRRARGALLATKIGVSSRSDTQFLPLPYTCCMLVAYTCRGDKNLVGCQAAAEDLYTSQSHCPRMGKNELAPGVFNQTDFKDRRSDVKLES